MTPTCEVVVFSGGEAPEPSFLPDLGRGVFVIAADSGFDHARALGVDIDLVVGDLDSVSDIGRAAIQRGGIAVLGACVDKDETDLELALDAAADRTAGPIALVGGHGARLDHALGVVAAIAAPHRSNRFIAYWGRDRATVVRSGDDVTLGAADGSIVSLLPCHGNAVVSITGVRWPLAQSTLLAGRARGVSNLVTDPPAHVVCHDGIVLAVEIGVV